jgi:hypothetical protein
MNETTSPFVTYQTIIASGFASLVVIIYYIFRYKLDKEIAKRELFTEFNQRYNGKINDRLENLIFIEFETDRDHQLHGQESLFEIWENLFKSEPSKLPKSISIVYDYLNLCSEQYYWYKKGFIDENAWECWNQGMKSWHRNSFFIKSIVKKEKDEKANYYNQDFLDLFV